MNPEKVIKYFLPFFVFAVVSRAIDEINFFYYSVPVLCLLFIIYFILELNRNRFKLIINKAGYNVRSDGIRYQVLFLILFVIPGIWFLITSIWSSYPVISATRSVYYILISAGCISAGILWKKFSSGGVFDFILPANIFIILLCLFSLITRIPSDSWTGGHGKGFMGFFGHQNTLASLLLFTLPAALGITYEILSKKPVTKSKIVTRSHFAKLNGYKIFFISILILNILFIILSYSRSVILSVLFGLLVFLLINKKWKVLGLSTVTLLIASLIILVTPSLNNFTSNIIKKDFPEFYSSRLWMWEPSFEAAIHGGITGLGYGISDPDIQPGSIGDHYEGERFIREKGNSVLALIEETGLIGLVLFLIPMIYVFIKFKIYNLEFRMKKEHQKNYTLCILHSALFAFLLHAQFEAWWVGVGSVQLPLFFLYLGLLTRQTTNNRIEE